MPKFKVNNIGYTLEKIKFATDGATFEKAVDLYEKGKVNHFKTDTFGFFAIVKGGGKYEVSVSRTHYDKGDCDCYLGREGILCKHMVAVALQALLGGKSLNKDEKTIVSVPASSGVLGKITKDNLKTIKAEISDAMRCIKAYDGPSRTWFQNQHSLEEGCRRLSSIFSELPVCVDSAKTVIATLLKLDVKLSRGGVDDSNGIVGDFIQSAVVMLQDYAKIDPLCINAFKVFEDKETCFQWEEPLVALAKSQQSHLGKKVIKKDSAVKWQTMKDKTPPVIVWDGRIGKVVREKKIFKDNVSIGTGLGGRGQFLRYSVAISALPNIKIGEEETKIIKDVIKKINIDKKVVEEYTFKDSCVSMLVLIDFETVPESVMKRIINNINKKKVIMRSHYYMVNTHVLSEADIKTYLKEIKGYNRTDWD